MRDLPAVLSVEVQTLPMIRVESLPAHLRDAGATSSGEVHARRARAPVDAARRCSTRSRRRYPVLRGTIRDHVTQKRRPFVRFFACEEDLSHEPPDTPLPDAVVAGDGAVPGRRRDGRRLMRSPDLLLIGS